jgi:hypothetical protein
LAFIFSSKNEYFLWLTNTDHDPGGTSDALDCQNASTTHQSNRERRGELLFYNQRKLFYLMTKVITELAEKLSAFAKASVYDPFKKWMDNCYRGVPLGGIG